DEIKQALDKVCSYLPSSLSSKCVQFVNEYTDLLITLVMEELEPELVCAKLNLCPSKVKVEKPKDIKDVECDLCKQVVGKVEDMVKDKKTEVMGFLHVLLILYFYSLIWLDMCEVNC
ncbi:prosaposin, partial [Nephila pilipes]